MQIKKLDTSVFLREKEKVELKDVLKSSKIYLIEKLICLGLWLVTLVVDCFLVGVMYKLKDLADIGNALKDQPLTLYLIVFVFATILHLVPFAFWLISIMKKGINEANKWYAITNERVVVVSETRPKKITSLEFADIISYQIGKNSVKFFLNEDRFVINGINNMEEVAKALKIHIIGEEGSSFNLQNQSETKSEMPTAENVKSESENKVENEKIDNIETLKDSAENNKN